MRHGRIIHGRDREVLFPHIRKTETLRERLAGLLGCPSLPEGHGLLIVPCSSIHTFFMRIPIDVIFLARDLRIVKIAANVRPYRTTMAARAASVLEIAAGGAARAGLRAGDQLLWEQS